jgi:hypothetical protein
MVKWNCHELSKLHNGRFSHCIMPAGQVSQSLQGCMTSRTGPMSTTVHGVNKLFTTVL